ncbi:MAG TPA: hypothetical protein PLE30_10320 [Candidatus Kapabacteria bacterium]|nr:hypothetical protein [Candidatus Kapabacteria bacterium]
MKDTINNSENLIDLAIKLKFGGRTKNFLIKNKLSTAKKYEEFLKRHNSFLGFETVGRKTTDELLQLANQVLPNFDLSKFQEEKKLYKVRDKYKIEADKNLVNIIKSDDPDYYIKTYIYFNLQFINPRLSKILNEKLAELNILSYIEYISSFNTDVVQGIGENKSANFKLLVAHLNKIITTAIQQPNYFKSFNFLPDAINHQCEKEVINQQGLEAFLNKDKTKVYFLKLLTFLLDTDFFGDDRETIIFKNRAKVYNDAPKKSMIEISKQFELTGERIRQIYIYIEEKFWNKIEMLSFVLGLNRIENDYYLDNNDDIYSVNINRINRIEEINVSEAFAFRVIYYFYKEKFIPLYLKYKNKDLNLFISKKYKNINFTQIIDDIESLKHREEVSKLQVNVRDFIRQYAGPEYTNDDTLLNIFRQVMENAAEAQADKNNNIEIKRYYKYMYEYVVEVLQEEDAPLKLNQIYNRIEVKFPGIIKNLDALRGNIQTVDKFIYFGRSSTYGLKEWEEQGKVKGGTIKQIVEEYLESRDTPAHISEIAKYVALFRETTESNIMGNLKFDRFDTFRFFNSSYVGLKSKTYSVKDLNFNKINLNLFRKTFARMFSNNVSKLKYNEFIEELSKRNKLTKIQIISIVQKRLDKGTLKLNKDGYLEKIDSSGH